MNSRPILPNLSGRFPHDQQLQFAYGASYPNNGPGLHNAAPNRVASDQPGAPYLPNLTQEPLVPVSQDLVSLSDVELTATLMGPSPKRRKKAPTLRANDWEPYRTRILELHDEQKVPLPKVKTMIEEEFGFTAGLRQYRTRITQWGKDKNVKSQEMSAIVRKRQQRRLVEVDKREQTFTVRGRDVEPHKIDRWMTRNNVSQTSLYAPSPAASTPSAVGCQTISERGSVASSPAFPISNLNFSPRDITSIVSSPAAPSPVSSLGETTYPHNTTFAGQSPAPINQLSAAHSSASHSVVSNVVSNEQLPRRYQQDDEDGIRKSLSAAEDLLGINHPQTLQLRIDLGIVLMSQGRYKSAEETARRAIEDCRRLESNSAIMLGAKVLLIRILDLQGSFHQALKLAESTFESSKAILEKHPCTLRSMETLSQRYLKDGKLKDAEDLCAQAIKASKTIFGERNEHTLRYMVMLSFIYIEQGQLSDAEKLLLQMLQTVTELFGKMHEFTIDLMSNVAYIYCLQGRSKDAEEIQVQAVEMSILLFGEEHPYTLKLRMELVEIYVKQGQLKKAEDLGERVLVARKKVHGEQHPETLESMSFMAHVYANQGRFKEAEDLGVQVLMVRKKFLGEQHPYTLKATKLIREIHGAQEELSEAEGFKEQEPELEMDWRAS
ncbi:unnamed protein product [Fusarium graminearum]|nr:unnamed protein product [Fusarium graminearum]